MFEVFQYGFILRGLEAGLLIGFIAPLIGVFLVLRRYSLIADTLSHVSLAGVAVGLLLKVNPLLTALGASVLSSLAIERLRQSRKIYGETALSIFLSGSLALAIVLIGISGGFNVDLFSYLFGSIFTVKPSDIFVIMLLGLIIIAFLFFSFKELIYISFDEESAKVGGIPVKFFNTIFIFLSATVIAISIPIIGILLVSALLVIPVITALQLRKSFKLTIVYAEIISLFSVLSGIVSSYYLDVSSGGMIVLIMLAIFVFVYVWKGRKMVRQYDRT